MRDQNTYIRALAVAIGFMAVQLATGCHWEPCVGFGFALFFGWSACEAVGTWRSLLGLLTLSLYVKTVLFGCLVKTLLLQPMDQGVAAPGATSAVFALGFAGVWISVLAQRLAPLPTRPRIWIPLDARSSLLLFWVIFIVSGSCWLFVFFSQLGISTMSGPDLFASMDRVYNGPGLLMRLFPIAPIAAVFYAVQKDKKRLLSHPVVILSVAASAIPGILGASKQDLMEPFAAVIVSVLLLRGIRYKPLLGLIAAATVILVAIVYPLLQASRYDVRGGRSLQERIMAIQNAWKGLLTDYGGTFDQALGVEIAPSYLPRVIAPLDRFVRYVEASRLVDATLISGEYTGFFTLTWGLRQIPPRSILPDKPLENVNNWLSRYTGDAGDERTNFAYGFMASFFNAFGYSGAFFGSLFLYTIIGFWLRFFVESRSAPNIWMVVLFLLFENNLVEDSTGAILSGFFWAPLPVVIYSFVVGFICSRVLPTPRRRPGDSATPISTHVQYADGISMKCNVQCSSTGNSLPHS